MFGNLPTYTIPLHYSKDNSVQYYLPLLFRDEPLIATTISRLDPQQPILLFSSFATSGTCSDMLRITPPKWHGEVRPWTEAIPQLPVGASHIDLHNMQNFGFPISRQNNVGGRTDISRWDEHTATTYLLPLYSCSTTHAFRMHILPPSAAWADLSHAFSPGCIFVSRARLPRMDEWTVRCWKDVTGCHYMKSLILLRQCWNCPGLPHLNIFYLTPLSISS